MTINDLIEREQRTCYPRTELTFKLIGLNHYLPSDATWVNDQGMAWDLPRLVSEEIRQPVRGACCGGTHRLIGLSVAYKKREQLGNPSMACTCRQNSSSRSTRTTPTGSKTPTGA